MLESGFQLGFDASGGVKVVDDKSKHENTLRETNKDFFKSQPKS